MTRQAANGASSWRLLAETLEARILHSADLSPLGWGGPVAAHAGLAEATPAKTAEQATEIAFVDAGLPDAGVLIADLHAQQSAGRRIEVVTIEAGLDGLALIGQTLAGRSDIGAVHVLAHGSDGRLQLGTTFLDAQSLLQRADELAAWSSALTADADLLLYGCDLAQGAAGQRLVQGLAALTGADVAASTDLTGAAARGGNWTLEFSSGAIEAAVAPGAWAQAQWQGVLATYTVTTTLDVVGASLLPGSLRWAISQANANPGADRIVFAVNGNFNLAALSSGGDDNIDGDFDITGSVDIVGNGSALTVINGNGLDRVFDLRSGTVTMSGLTIKGGASNTGAGLRITNTAALTLTDAVVESNVGKGATKGGGIYNDGTLTLNRVTVQNNGDTTSGDADGGGIYNDTDASLNASDVTLAGNVANGKDGGGLYINGGNGSVTLQNVTISGNTAKNGGGAINKQTGTTLSNVTIAGNKATSQGGGLWSSERLSLDHVTVAANSSPLAGGVFDNETSADKKVSATNSLFAANSGGNTNRALTSGGYNLSDDASLGFAATGDLANTAAGIGSLAANGGFTRTVAIGAGSAARDAANPVGAPAADQRGLATFGGRSDIGAYEYSPYGFPPTISAVANQTINEDQTLSSVGFTVGDPESNLAILVLSATSSNTALVPTANIVFGGSGANRTVSLTPAPNANSTANGGPTTITLTVSDGGNSTSTSFVVTVLPQNDAPTGSVTISGTPAQGQTLTAAHTLADADGLGTISYQWFADGAALSGATGSTLLLGQAQVGKAISVSATYTDGGGTAERAVSAATAAVANVNDAPTGSVTISGTPTQGQTLTAANSLADDDGLGAISYQWRADGTAISGATGSTLLLAQAQVGKAITVTASYTDGYGTAESVSSAATAAVANVNDAPTGSVTISGTPMQGQTLTASNTLADADGLGTISYQWRANGTAFSGATSSTFVLGQAQVGKTITVTASYTDGGGTAESVTSGATAAVANINDAPTGSVTITGTPSQGQTLTATNSLADADGLGTIIYHWNADGIAIGGATGSTLLLAQAQVGKAITVTASYTDGLGAAESVTSTATAAVANVNDVPTGSVTISGTPTQGQTLTAANSLADIDGLGTIAYQWKADGVAIAGATGSTLLLAQAQVGKAITVTASYTDGYGTVERVSSAATAAVANVNDAPTGSVTISGTPTQGQTLTAANSLADTDGLGAISYQWKADGAAISGATGSTLLLAQAQVGRVISVTASYTDGYGAAESVSSAATTAVANVNDLPTGTLTIHGTPTRLQTLTFTNTLADADGLGPISYQWAADGVDIAGATGTSFVLVTAQVGTRITVRASYTDGFGTNESVTSMATAVVTPFNNAPTGSVTISGTPTQGQTLTAANTLADADGLGAISYQWNADGVAISGATGSTLLLAQAQVGTAITVTASYIDGGATGESVSSLATAPVANINDAPTGSVTISGTPTQGQTLTAANTLADADGLGVISYQWSADGSAISGATGSTLLLAQEQVGKAITVTASYTDGFGTAESVVSAATAAVTNDNDAPTGSVTISGTPTQGQTLTAANSLADADGLGAISYQWNADGTAISGATGSTLVLAQAHVGKAITVTASYTDGFGTAESVSSAATAVVANVNDAPTGSVTISGTPTQGQTLTAANSLADADGLGAIIYQWNADGSAISGATGSTLLLDQAHVGKAITVTATYTDGYGTAESLSSAATGTVANDNDAPTGSVTISGTPTQGQTLTAANSLADADGLGAISYQWNAGGIAISGATGSTLVLAQAHVGRAITVTASYTDGFGTAESVSSAATAAVANVNDAPTGSVSITGTSTQGQTLTAADTLADADGLGTISYQWFADGAALSGSTGSTLLLGQAQVGKAISVSASYTDGGGTAESVVSAATAAVANVNDAPTGSVTISGTPTQGQTLTAANSLADADGLGAISYQWNEDGTAISGATGSTLVLAQAQVGRAITVTASYTDGYGTAESVSSAATAAVANVNDAPTGSVTVSGTPTQGQTLTAANSLADVDGLGAISYQWNADGIAIGGATGSTLLLSQAEVGRAISVTASYTDGLGAAESVTSTATAAVANVNDVPTGSVTITGTAAQGETLTASNSLADADGLGAISYQWSADGTTISGATGSTLVLGQAQVGRTISVTASYTDGFGATESVSSLATAAVANVNDNPTGSVAIAGTPTQGQTLTAANSLGDADGLGAISYQWNADGIAISGATGSTLVLAQAQVGRAISVTASYTDGFDAAESVSSLATAAVANINDVLTGSVSITGTPTQGQTLSASNTLADADGLGTVSYQWVADGVAIGGATGSTLVLAQAQVGKAITVTATYTDGYGTAESMVSAATAAVTNNNDAPTGSVTVSGTPTQGQMLTAANTLADADGLGAISYQWSADGIAIRGANGSTLLLAQAQVGRAISVTASYTDGFGNGESVSSLATAAVANVNDNPTGSLSITGTPTQGQTLTASNTLTDADGLGTVSYQWSADGIAIGGATGSTLLLAQAQVGTAISVTASYTDGFGAAESVSSLATAAVANVNDNPTGSLSITGTPTQGQTLTASNTLADADGLGAISYQWSADGIAIGGATGSTLLLSQSQVGQTISVTATFTDGFGAAESLTGAATAAVANINDAPTGSVSITGMPTQGQTLTASNTLADADGLGAVSYQWKADGVAISGATGGTLVLGQAEFGKVISVIVSYTDALGGAESVTSAATAPVAAANRAPVLTQGLADQTAMQGTTLQFALPPTTFTDADAGDTLSFVATLADGSALPQWISFNGAQQVFAISPPLGSDTGPVWVRVVANDAAGASAQLVFAVVMVLPPVDAIVPAAAPPVAAPAPTAVIEANLDTPKDKTSSDPESAAPVQDAAPAPVASGPVLAVAPESPEARVTAAAPGLAAQTPTSRSASRADAVLAAEPVLQYSDLAGAQLLQLLKGDDMLRKLDELKRQMTESSEAHRNNVMASSVVMTTGLSVGYVVWLVRGGVLVSSMLSALPAWQMIDPMPVLAAGGALARRRMPAPSDEPEVERFFGDGAREANPVRATTAEAATPTGRADTIPDPASVANNAAEPRP